MSDICQLCAIIGHTASTCPCLHTRCVVPDCDGVMIPHTLDGHVLLKCHRDTCSAHIPCAQPVDSQESVNVLPCEVYGLTGHRPYECPSSRPFQQVDDQKAVLQFELDMYEKCSQYLFDEAECSHGQYTYDFHIGCLFCDLCGAELEDQ